MDNNGNICDMNINSAAFHRSRHLNKNEIYPKDDNCPVCLSREVRDSVYLLQRDPDITMLRCKKCKAVSASHMPKDDVLDDYYGSYYSDNSTQVTFSGFSRFAENILASIDIESLPSAINILDFGGGNGSLSVELGRKLLEKGKVSSVRITLVDYQEPLPTKWENITIVHKQRIEDVNDTFDVVLASAIFEHIPELNPVIDKIFKSINKDGYLYVRTPYMLPLAMVLKKLDLTYPAHVHDLGSSFWGRAIEVFELKAEVIVSRPSIVETSFSDNFSRTLLAYLLKAPGHFETLLLGKRKDRMWNLVGGWEAIFKF